MKSFNTILAVLVIAVSLPSVSSAMMPAPPLGSQRIDLIDPASRLVSLGDVQLLAISAKAGLLMVVDVRTGRVVSSVPYAKELLDVVALDIVGPAGPKLDAQASRSATFPSAPQSTHRVWLLGRADVQSPPMVEVLDVQAGNAELRALPGGAFPAPAGDPHLAVFGPGGEVVIEWDTQEPAKGGTLHLVGPDGPRDVPTIFSPTAIALIGSDRLVMAIDAPTFSAALVSPLTGEPEDLVSVAALTNRNPGRTRVFAVAATDGGSGDVLIVNPTDGILSDLSVENAFPIKGGFAQRIATPLQISGPIRASYSPTQRSNEVLAAASRDLSVILVGFGGSETLQVFRKSGRALDSLGSLRLDGPVADLTALASDVAGQESFAFLSADGLQIEILSAADIRSRASGDQAIDGNQQQALLRDNDVAGAQRVLAFLGYPVGAIDGRIGAVTAAALRAYQLDHDLPTSGQLDRATLDKLNDELIRIATTGRSSPGLAADYRRYIERAVPGVDADQLLYLGRPHQSIDSRCFGLNSLPPQLVWPNSVGLAKIIKDLSDEFGMKVQTTSAYRNFAYDTCVGSTAAASHLGFYGVDLVPPPTETRAAMIDDLTELQSTSDVAFDLRPDNPDFVHVELKATDLVQPPTVYVQFSGSTRSPAQDLSQQLSNAGFIVPGAERVASAEGLREIRYYYPEDKATAETLAKIAANALADLGYGTAPVKLVDLAGWSKPKPAPGVFELWVGI